ncbi:hypothetical protein ACOMHN_005650 [Nucella lapillus]
MVKGKRTQPSVKNPEREKRPRQQAGYYATLHGKKSRNQPSSSRRPKTSSLGGSQQQDMKDWHQADPPQSFISPPQKLLSPPQSAVSPPQPLVKTETLAPKAAGEESTPRVTAIVREEVSESSDVVTQGLHGNAPLSPRQPDPVALTEEEGQITITGSMSEVLHVLQTMTQMKNNERSSRAGELSPRETTVEKGLDSKTIYIEREGQVQAVSIQMPLTVPSCGASSGFSHGWEHRKPDTEHETAVSPHSGLLSGANQSETQAGVVVESPDETNGSAGVLVEGRSLMKTSGTKLANHSNLSGVVELPDETNGSAGVLVEGRSLMKTSGTKLENHSNLSGVVELPDETNGSAGVLVEGRSLMKTSGTKLANHSNLSGVVELPGETNGSAGVLVEGRSLMKTSGTKPANHSNLSCVESERSVTESVESVNEHSTVSSNPCQVLQAAEESASSLGQQQQEVTSPVRAAFKRCGVCEVPCGEEEEEARMHMKSAHESKEMPLSCAVCNLLFPFKRGLLTHLKSVHWSPNLICQICGKKFEVQRYLVTHLMRHAGVKKFECNTCGRRFFERHKLKFHKELHKQEADRQLPYNCRLCGKKFANKASWSDHCNTHSGDRPFACDACGACFSHRVGLRRHKLTHEKVKPFKCMLCVRTFAVKPKLDEHMTTHTGVSKHVCSLCSKVFTTSSSVKRHEIICREAREERRMARLFKGADKPAPPPEDLLEDVLPSSEQVVFMCGHCQASFSTFRAAEQHTLIHRTQECESLAPSSLLEDAGGGDSSEMVSAPSAPSTDVLDSPASASLRQEVEGDESPCLSERSSKEVPEVVSRLRLSEGLCQTAKSVSGSLSWGEGAVSSTAASEQAALFEIEGEPSQTLANLGKDERSSEAVSSPTLPLDARTAASESLDTVDAVGAGTEKWVERFTNPAQDASTKLGLHAEESRSLEINMHGDDTANAIKGAANVQQQNTCTEKWVEPSSTSPGQEASEKLGLHTRETRSLETDMHGGNIGVRGTSDSDTVYGKGGGEGVVVVGGCEGGGRACFPAAERLNTAEVEEQTQLAANTLACLSSM